MPFNFMLLLTNSSISPILITIIVNDTIENVVRHKFREQGSVRSITWKRDIFQIQRALALRAIFQNMNPTFVDGFEYSTR